MFANDTFVCMHWLEVEIHEVIALVNEDFRNVEVWFRSNSILSNYDKTKVMFLGERKGTLLNSELIVDTLSDVIIIINNCFMFARFMY